MDDMVVVQGVRMTAAAAKNVEEVGSNVDVDVYADVVQFRATVIARGMAAALSDLLDDCLDGADPDRVSGWHDYVSAIERAAGKMAESKSPITSAYMQRWASALLIAKVSEAEAESITFAEFAKRYQRAVSRAEEVRCTITQAETCAEFLIECFYETGEWSSLGAIPDELLVTLRCFESATRDGMPRSPATEQVLLRRIAQEIEAWAKKDRAVCVGMIGPGLGLGDGQVAP